MLKVIEKKYISLGLLSFQATKLVKIISKILTKMNNFIANTFYITLLSHFQGVIFLDNNLII